MKKFFVGIIIVAAAASGYSYKAAVYSGENFSRVNVSGNKHVLRVKCSRFTMFCTSAANSTPKPLDIIHIPVKIAG